MLSLRDRAARAAIQHAALTIAFWPVLVLVRAYELVLVHASHILPPGTGEAFLRGVLHDLATALWIGLLLIPVGVIAIWWPRVGRVVHQMKGAVLAVIAVMFSQYFAITFVPLGADFWGYSLKDIKETTLTSTGVHVVTVLPFIVIVSLWWYFSTLSVRRLSSPRIALGVGIAAALSVLAAPIVTPTPQRFNADTPYFLAVNKPAYFARGSWRYFAERRALAGAAEAFTGYPLLRPATHDDVLGPFFNKRDTKPNIVIVLVEGLGRDFVGPNARYGGFTPFIDSLATQSLYFDNYMSVAGRTFGALPAVLGSLPFGNTGFMELGSKMPRHIGLVNLLRDQGYLTSYFTGTDGHFDNIDVFLEREGIERFIDASRFGAGYEKEPAGDGGFTWGYGDRELFRRSLAEIGSTEQRPRLDVYLTITTHEPFIPPNRAHYEQLFTQRLQAVAPSGEQRAEYQTYKGIFSTLLYLDDALREFFAEYAKRPDFGRTIFLVTGDHRLIPIPPNGRADRYHVPLIIASPLLKAPAHISSVSSHLDITPTLLAFLEHNYSVRVPEQVAWLGTGIDTVRTFRSTHSLALMRVKGQLDEYLDGDTFISGDQAFRLGSNFTLSSTSSDSARTAATRKLARFIQLNRFVSGGDHLYPGGVGDTTSAEDARQQDSVFAALALEKKTPTDAFFVARDLAFAKRYPPARLILRKQLREIPNFHDARALLGRTYGWEGHYDTGRAILNDLARRAPDYADGFVARVDLEIWSDHPQTALAIADTAVARFPAIGDVRIARAHALEQLGRKAEAIAELDHVRPRDPAESTAKALRVRLQR